MDIDVLSKCQKSIDLKNGFNSVAVTQTTNGCLKWYDVMDFRYIHSHKLTQITALILE